RLGPADTVARFGVSGDRVAFQLPLGGGEAAIVEAISRAVLNNGAVVAERSLPGFIVFEDGTSIDRLLQFEPRAFEFLDQVVVDEQLPARADSDTLGRTCGHKYE